MVPDEDRLKDVTKEQLAWALVQIAELYLAKCNRIQKIELALRGVYDK